MIDSGQYFAGGSFTLSSATYCELHPLSSVNNALLVVKMREIFAVQPHQLKMCNQSNVIGSNVLAGRMACVPIPPAPSVLPDSSIADVESSKVCY